MADHQNPLHLVEAFYQRCLRRILRIKWFMKTSNEEVLQRAGMLKPSSLATVWGSLDTWQELKNASKTAAL